MRGREGRRRGVSDPTHRSDFPPMKFKLPRQENVLYRSTFTGTFFGPLVMVVLTRKFPKTIYLCLEKKPDHAAASLDCVFF